MGSSKPPMELSDIGSDFYKIDFEKDIGTESPYKKIREWAGDCDFIDGWCVRAETNGRNTDLRKIGLHRQRDEDLFHDRYSRAFFLDGEDYGILLRPDDYSTSEGAKNYHVASILGLHDLDYEYGDIIVDEEFELVAQELDEFTDIDSFLTSREVYVDEVNAENAGSETFKYRNRSEE